MTNDSNPVVPSQVTQRCATCKHKKTAHVENDGEWAYCNDCGPEFAGVHEFEVEDEGARPLTWPNPQVGGMRANIIARMVLDRTTTDTLAAAYVADFEAAIRKEAIAAQVELEEAAYRHAEHWQSLYNDAFDQATVQRTRAGAAEGALRGALELLDSRGILDKRTDDWARALTAESVTGEDK